MAAAAVAAPFISSQPAPKTSQSRRTSIMSSSVTSFKTAPLAASSMASASTSRDSLTSQNTLSAQEARRSQLGGQDALASTVASAATSPPYPNGAPFAMGPLKGKEREAREASGGGKALPPHPMILPPRLDTQPQTYYTPPSPPPSASPTEEKSFDISTTPKKSAPNFCETPAALSSSEQNQIISFQESSHPIDQGLAPRPGNLRSTTGPVLPSVSFKPTPELPLAGSSSGNGAYRRRGSRGSEDTASVSTATSSFPKATSITLAGASTQDGNLLQPPPTSVRPARRNTTGSATSRPARSNNPAGPASGEVPSSQGFPSYGPYDEGIAAGELDSDILKEAEQIRAERRAKAQQEAEQAMTGPSRVREDAPLVGHIIGEDHVNYILMYNMLTGIRVAVSRCQAKIKKELTDQDFSASHKYSFDVIGKELTPSAKYDFKFKDYAPNVFRQLREDHFQLDPSDYLVSLTDKYILSELGSPGKSGSFFYFSRDYRFIIKTLHHAEHKFLRKVLKQYTEHIKSNPHSLLSRFYGLHRVKLPRGKKIHFVIMNNLFPPHRDIHETYDLKGSTVGREYPEERAGQGAVLKDLNWIHRGRSLELGPEKRALLTEQIRRDTELLKEINVMDYSLLIGIHNMQRGNRDNLRRNTLKVYSPSVVPNRRPTSSQVKSRAEAIAIRKAMRESDPKALGSHPTADLPDEDPEDNKQFLFYQDEGGLRATDETNEPMDTIYYLGIIDICTPWTTVKRMENIWKGFKNDRHKISPVPAREYGERFFSFMQAIMRGGEGGDRFLEKPPERQKEE